MPGSLSPVKPDVHALKAVGIISQAREQLQALAQDNWHEVVSEGSANTIRKELERCNQVFATRGNAAVNADLEGVKFYGDLIPFLTAFRLHRGIIPDGTLAGLSENIANVRDALSKLSGLPLSPFLELLHVQAAFLAQARDDKLSDA
eukprot:4207423-Alexandrium_andersonii.AAC.1